MGAAVELRLDDEGPAVCAMDAAYPHDFGMILVDRDSPTGVMPYALDWKGKVTYASQGSAIPKTFSIPRSCNRCQASCSLPMRSR